MSYHETGTLGSDPDVDVEEESDGDEWDPKVGDWSEEEEEIAVDEWE